MAKGNRYYWIKVKESFMTSDKVDFLMAQKDGANYVVLYQMLCLMTMNTDGVLSRTIGEVIIPYDVDKIQRDTKYFSKDTVMVALELYKQLGMIYVQEDGIMRIADFENMVGSETDYALQKRNQRAKLLTSAEQVDNGVDNVHTDNRDKILDNKNTNKRFVPPTVEEVKEYCKSRNNNVDAEQFVDFYTANGWKVGKNSMKDWKASVRTWERNHKDDKPKQAEEIKPRRYKEFEKEEWERPDFKAEQMPDDIRDKLGKVGRTI